VATQAQEDTEAREGTAATAVPEGREATVSPPHLRQQVALEGRGDWVAAGPWAAVEGTEEREAPPKAARYSTQGLYSSGPGRLPV